MKYGQRHRLLVGICAGCAVAFFNLLRSGMKITVKLNCVISFVVSVPLFSFSLRIFAQPGPAPSFGPRQLAHVAWAYLRLGFATRSLTDALTRRLSTPNLLAQGECLLSLFAFIFTFSPLACAPNPHHEQQDPNSRFNLPNLAQVPCTIYLTHQGTIICNVYNTFFPAYNAFF